MNALLIIYLAHIRAGGLRMLPITDGVGFPLQTTIDVEYPTMLLCEQVAEMERRHGLKADCIRLGGWNEVTR